MSRFRRWLLRKVQALGTETRVIHGVRIDVFNLRPDIEVPHLFARMEAALGLINLADPRRLHRLIHDVDVLHVHRGTTRGVHYPGQRICVLDNTFVANPAFSDVEIAACIVHEAMHARVSSMGVQRKPEDYAREERICRRAEIAFAERVPDGAGAPVLDRAGAILAAPDAELDFPIDGREVERRVLEADLKASTAPAWFKRLTARRHGFAWQSDGSVTAAPRAG